VRTPPIPYVPACGGGEHRRKAAPVFRRRGTEPGGADDGHGPAPHFTNHKPRMVSAGRETVITDPRCGTEPGAADEGHGPAPHFTNHRSQMVSARRETWISDRKAAPVAGDGGQRLSPRHGDRRTRAADRPFRMAGRTHRPRIVFEDRRPQNTPQLDLT